MAPSFISVEIDTELEEFSIKVDASKGTTRAASYHVKLVASLIDYPDTTSKIELPFKVNIMAKKYKPWTPPTIEEIEEKKAQEQSIVIETAEQEQEQEQEA